MPPRTGRLAGLIDRLRSFPYGRLALALGVGALGGMVFYQLGIPLPWMLGSLAFCLIAATLRFPVQTPDAVRTPMAAIIGSMLGANYTVETFRNLDSWLVPLAGLVIFLVVCAVVCVGYFRLVARYDAKTAYFCGMPGGFIEMALLGEQYGADIRKIALVHAVRIALIVAAIPFIVQFASGVDLVRGSGPRVGLADVSPAALGWFAFTCVAGLLLGGTLRIPAGFLLGPMIISSLVHLTGLTDFTPPFEIVILAQVVMGASIGCRFAGITKRELVRILGWSAGSTVILLAITLAFAWAGAALSDHLFQELVIAYSPGGLVEMGLVAIAVHAEVAFVTTHHIMRIALVTFGASAWLRLRDWPDSRSGGVR